VDGDTVASARVGFLSVADVPTVVDVTDALSGGVSAETTAAAGEVALASLDPADDLHATAAYRSQLVRVLTSRALRAAYDDALARGGWGG
jgi:carbon-monoxide dehydrogenase medium subunit